MRPELTKALSAPEFRSYYWLKEELQAFCRGNRMSASGSKQEITERIAVFLETGEIQKPTRKRAASKSQPSDPLSLDTVITEDHRCSQAVRAFFKSQIPTFHFSTAIQDYFRDNAGKTYRDAVQAWHEEEARKKAPGYQKQIGSQFEYNTFIRDYFADPKNKGNGREAAIEAWKAIKQQPGSNAYIRKT